jgi:gliding motility-associated-like protein
LIRTLAINSGTALIHTGGTMYTTSVSPGTNSIAVTTTAVDPNATITVNNIAVAGGAQSGPVALNAGPTIIPVVITAQDGVTMNTYTITVSKSLSNNDQIRTLAINSGTALVHTGGNFYATTVNPGTSSIAVTATTVDPNATITVNNMAVASGVQSGPVPLTTGTTMIAVVVTAQDGVTAMTYTITVTEPAPPGLNSLYQPVAVVEPAATVTIENDGIAVHQGVSPNGDGINDVLLIDGITAYPDNRLTIINRGGTLVFQAKSYDNTTRVFDGHSNINGRMQLPGTYFYSLDYSVNGQNKHKTGFIILRY